MKSADEVCLSAHSRFSSPVTYDEEEGDNEAANASGARGKVELGDQDGWDDSALVNAFEDAVTRYQVAHGLRTASGAHTSAFGCTAVSLHCFFLQTLRCLHALKSVGRASQL